MKLLDAAAVIAAIERVCDLDIEPHRGDSSVSEDAAVEACMVAIRKIPAAPLPAAWGREELAAAIADNPRIVRNTQPSNRLAIAILAADIALSRPLPPVTDEMVERAAHYAFNVTAPLERGLWVNLDDERRAWWMDTARAILAAAREPKP